MATPQERAALARQQKLADIERQVRDGSLVIRPMTAAERAKYPRPAQPRRQRGKL
jgi:hypothetical protein